jgi:type VI secretion system secreted protein VgrG
VSAFAILALPLAVTAQPGLGTAQSFAVLAGANITNTGPTTIAGHVGTAPGYTVSGFPPGLLLHGDIHQGDQTASRALEDIRLFVTGMVGPCDGDLTGQDLGGGRTLTPGLYCLNGPGNLNGNLLLDAQGDPNARFIFVVGGPLDVAADARILNQSGGSPCGVYWVVGGKSTLHTGSIFTGTLIGLNDVTLDENATVNGRLLSRSAINLNSNAVAVVECGTTATVPLTWSGMKSIYRD